MQKLCNDEVFARVQKPPCKYPPFRGGVYLHVVGFLHRAVLWGICTREYLHAH